MAGTRYRVASFSTMDMKAPRHAMRIGIDLGGTKVAATLLDVDGAERARYRADTPRDYDGTLAGLAAAVADLERQAGVTGAREVIGARSPRRCRGSCR